MRASPNLPPDLTRALERLAHGVSRNAMAARAAAQSDIYRAGGGSQAIATADDAFAYAFARMPATYAAAAAAFGALAQALPEFQPKTLLDVGAGPGTASFAAVAAFPELADVRLADANARLRALALTLMAEADSDVLRRVAKEVVQQRGQGGQEKGRPADPRPYRCGDALALLADAAPADLVVASYVAGEIPDGALDRFALALWAATAGALAIIEPGTTGGFLRILRMRAALIGAGAQVAAPCPHSRPCPLAAPDWCHFAQRLPRSRDHLQVKGAEVPFEDEKFSYVVLARTPPRPAAARVLAPPRITKVAATAKLCADGGIVLDTAARRDADAYRRRKSWRWGDGVAP